MATAINPMIDDLTEYIDNSLFSEGQPHIRGRRITIYWIIAHARENNWGIARLAQEFSLNETQVLAAILYYQLHHEEVDAQESALEEKYRHYGEN